MLWDNHRPPPTIKDFDNKVSEADAYLQLMIDQTKVNFIQNCFKKNNFNFFQNLEERIKSMSDGDDKAKCQVILEHANVS